MVQEVRGSVLNAFENAVNSQIAAVNSNIAATVNTAIATLSANLAAVTGSGLVGYGGLYPNQVLRTVRAKLGDIIHVEDFGAVCNGVTNDAPALQAAINAVPNSRGVVLLPPKTLAIASTITMRRGVSLIGVDSTAVFDESDNVPVTKILWTGANGGVMFSFFNRWRGRVENINFDGNYTAGTILNLGGPQSSIFRNLVVEKTTTSIAHAAVSIDMNNQTYSGGAQYPSSGLNIFDTVIVRDAKRTGMLMRGVEGAGGATLASVTKNTFINCKFNTTGTGEIAVVLDRCCDTNYWYGGGIDGAPGGTGLLINFSTTNDETYGNNFYAVAFENLNNTGVGIDVRNTRMHNFLYGCYLPSQGTPYVITNATNRGKLKIVGASYGNLSRSFKSQTSPVVGTSPWTWINETGELVEFRLWGGTTTAVSVSRNGLLETVGGVTPGNLATFLIEPNDSIQVTYSGAVPTVQLCPH